MVIDAGIRAKGGFKAGELVTEICMGGLGKLEYPAENTTDRPFSRSLLDRSSRYRDIRLSTRGMATERR